MTVRILTGDCRDVLATLPECSIDSVVTDPPYHLTNRTPDVKWCVDCNRVLGGSDGKPAVCPRCGVRLENQRSQGGRGFMGQTWDGGDVAFRPETWAAVFRVLKPGAHLLAFGGTRTFHRLVCAIEDAGFEIRDQIGWAYGQGFPKSLDVSKAIDKAAGAKREVVGIDADRFARLRNQIDGSTSTGGQWEHGARDVSITAPATPEAAAWQGWGTALKPAYEPVCVAQKPYTPQQVLAILAPTIGELICKVVSSAKTDMRLSALDRASGFLSTATSLNNRLAALYGQMSTFTTETASALTIDLKILKSSLSRLTQSTTTPASTLANGDESDASLVAAISRSVLAKCERLSSTTAGEIAIDWRALEGSDPAGSNISPAWEPIVLARKPFSGTVAGNVLAHGTGALNIDGCRVETDDSGSRDGGRRPGTHEGYQRPNATMFQDKTDWSLSPAGRWPANLVHDGSDEVLACFPETLKATWRPNCAGRRYGDGDRVVYGARGEREYSGGYLDVGSAARFFFCAKSSPAERGEGTTHPTVKPVDLMRWLIRLVTPPGGTVLDPFAGSGSTGIAASIEQMNATLIELSPEYAEMARARIIAEAGLFADVAAE